MAANGDWPRRALLKMGFAQAISAGRSARHHLRRSASNDNHPLGSKRERERERETQFRVASCAQPCKADYRVNEVQREGEKRRKRSWCSSIFEIALCCETLDGKAE